MKPTRGGSVRNLRTALLALSGLCALATPAAPAGPERYATLPEASPDGKHIAFVRDLPDQSSDIYVVDLVGLHQRLVAHVENGGLAGWMGGRSILLDLRSGDSTALCAVRLDGGARRTLFAQRALSAELSNDGRRVAYAQGGWTRGRLFVANLDGTDARALTDSTAGWFNMAWSPDDRTIAVTRLDSTRALEVWCVDVRSGAGRAVLTLDDSKGRPQWPSWSPDGKRIAAQAGRYDRENPEKNEADIWVVDADGGRAHRITSRDRPWMDETPSWLPDGKRIAFQSTRTGRFEVWVMNEDGSGARQVTR